MNDDGLYYAVFNWADKEKWASLEHPLWLNYVDGKLTLDDYSKVGEHGDFDLYFTASYSTQTIPGGTTWHSVSDYPVSNNKTTQTLNFSGTFDGKQVYVGIWGEHYITREWTVFDDTQVRDAKLVLTPNASLAPKSVGNFHPETGRKSFPNTVSTNRTATRSQSSKASIDRK